VGFEIEGRDVTGTMALPDNASVGATLKQITARLQGPAGENFILNLSVRATVGRFKIRRGSKYAMQTGMR
jgi:hypothetical protein